MTKKNLLTALLVAPMLIGGVSACGGGGGGGNKDVIEIRFAQNTDKSKLSPIIERAAEAFNKNEEANPGLKIHVDASQESGSFDLLRENTLKKIPTGDYCDIFYGYPDSIQAINKYKVVQDLDEFINDSEVGLTQDELNDIIPAYLQEGANYPDEGRYSMPFSKSTEVMYYNRDILGLDLSSIDPSINNGNPLTEAYINNLTWDELFEKLCPALLTKNEQLDDEHKLIIPKEDKSCVFAYDSDDNFFITLAKQYGYDYTSIDPATKKGSIDFANENMANLLVKVNEYYRKGYLMTKGSYGGSYTSNLFNDKACLFTVSSTAGAKNTYNSNFVTMPAHIPHVAGSKGYTISQGPSIAILKKEAAPEKAKAAWQFYRFFLRKYSLNWAVNSGYLPILESDYESDEWLEASSTDGKNPMTEEYNKAMTYSYIPQVSDDLFDSPVFTQSAAARVQAGSAMTQAIVYNGTLTKEQAMEIHTTCKNNAMNA